MSKLKVGIVGCGFVAQKRHIPSLLRLNGKVSLCAVCDLDQELARSVANKFGIPNVYSDLSEMLSREHPDVVRKAVELIHDDNLEELGTKARSFAERYSWDSIADKFERTLEETISAR